MKNKIVLATLLLLATTLVGCGSKKTVVINPSANSAETADYSSEEDDVEPEIIEDYEWAVSSPEEEEARSAATETTDSTNSNLNGTLVSLPFSTGVDKDGNLLEQFSGVDAYDQYMHFDVDGSLTCYLYGYLYGESLEDAHDTNQIGTSAVKDVVSNDDWTEMPYFYHLTDSAQVEYEYMLYDTSLEEQYSVLHPNYQNGLYTQLDDGVDATEAELTADERLSSHQKNSGESHGFPYQYSYIEWAEDYDDTFTVRFELSDTVRFSAIIKNPGTDFDINDTIEEIAANIHLD